MFTYKYILIKESPQDGYSKANQNHKITYWGSENDVFVDFAKLFLLLFFINSGILSMLKHKVLFSEVQLCQKFVVFAEKVNYLAI